VHALEPHLADRSLEVRMRTASCLSAFVGRDFVATARRLLVKEKNKTMRVVLGRIVAG